MENSASTNETELFVQNPDGLRAIRNLDYTVLLCHDVDRMKNFYESVLGFAVRTAIAGRWAELQVGSSSLALRGRTRPYDGPHPEDQSASIHLAFRVPPDDVEAAAQQLIEKGVELLEPIADLQPFGHRAFFFSDPEHNVVEIYRRSNTDQALHLSSN